MVPEKFDVVTLSHQVQVEYGNVGVDFKYVPREGFGWMNTSFEVGLTYLSTQLKRALGTCTDPDLLFKKMLENEQAKLSRAEQRDALSRRRESTIAARAILRKESDAVVTKISTKDINRSSISSPRSPDAFKNYLNAEQESESDAKLAPSSNYGDYLAPTAPNNLKIK